MNYSMYLCFAVATLGRADSAAQTPAETDVGDALDPILQRLRQLLQEVGRKPVSPQAVFDLEQHLQAQLRELGRVGIEWALNHIEPTRREDLPAHVEFEADSYTRVTDKTPQVVATMFGKIRLWRRGYRPTGKTADPTIFPLVHQLGIVAGGPPPLSHRPA